MSPQDQLIDEYYSRNRDKLIDCPFQPGNLKITEKACTKRRFAAGRNTEGFNRREDIFGYFVSQGLLRCKQCRMGEYPSQAI